MRWNRLEKIGKIQTVIIGQIPLYISNDKIAHVCTRAQLI